MFSSYLTYIFHWQIQLWLNSDDKYVSSESLSVCHLHVAAHIFAPLLI